MGRNFLYHRCSSSTQCADRAYNEAKKLGIPRERVFVDFISGTTEVLSRPRFSEMYELLEDGDIINVLTIGRFARKASAVFNGLDLLKSDGIILNLIDLKLNSTDRAFGIVAGIFASIAEAEREDLKEAQRQGIAAKKAMGLKCGGRPSIPDAVMMAAVSDYLKAQKPVSAICSDYSISPSKLYKYMKANNISR